MTPLDHARALPAWLGTRVNLWRRAQSEPSGNLFSRTRWRLTLWYSAVVAGALILSGVILYLTVQQSLLGPVNSALRTDAVSLSQTWQGRMLQSGGDVGGSCPSSFLIACYGPHGRLLNIGGPPGRLPPFTSPSLSASALRSGIASDTIQTHQIGDLSTVQRYAIRVPFPGGQGVMGVLQVSALVGSQASTLATLLRLLFLLGALTLLFSFAAGLFLANRALLPARLAYSRQRDFIADASHELRTPLTMLRSSVEFVLRGRDHLRPDDVSTLEDTVQETVHLTCLANNMLSLAQLDSETRVEEDIVDLAEVADEVVRWAHPLCQERGIEIDIVTRRPVLVVGDRPLLEQTALILVDNAIKYNRPGGSVHVEVREIGQTAEMRVSDTGIGISSEHLGRLGERFYRVDRARSRESGGAGLGLSIVRSIAARHGGSFHLDSEPKVGTRACFTLPLIATETQAESVDLTKGADANAAMKSNLP